MPTMAELPPDIEEQVARALAEDIGTGDVTARLVAAGARALATLVTREDMILCGSAWLRETFRQLDTGIAIDWRAQEGDAVAANAVICEIRGPARSVLSGERCALNFLQTLSGTATATRRYVNAVAGTACRILDTRKTIPGLRLAQKYAVRCGGGHNHRMGLHDMVLVKENHIIAAGSIGDALRDARSLAPGVPVEIEVEDLAELRAALAAVPDVVMIDEFGLEDMRAAVRLRDELAPGVRIEASGGVGIERLKEIAATGVDCVSIGALTKHLHAVDLSLRFTIS
jgi:nicotinate-nucleotide pyrophosphorylase (carboxylating)